MCLDDFAHHNIDVACNLLETCGRFLYRTPETHIRVQNMVQAPATPPLSPCPLYTHHITSLRHWCGWKMWRTWTAGRRPWWRTRTTNANRRRDQRGRNLRRTKIPSNSTQSKIIYLHRCYESLLTYAYRYLIYFQLNKNTAKVVLKQLRKLPWDTMEVTIELHRTNSLSNISSSLSSSHHPSMYEYLLIIS